MNAIVDQKHPLPVLGVGFRPFFLIGTLFAVLMTAIWMPWFLGLIQVPSAWSPQTWQTHELVLAFAPAIVAGVLLAVLAGGPRRKPLGGVALAALVVLWLAGRVAIVLSIHLQPVTAAVLSIAFLIVAAGVIARELMVSGDRRNLTIVALLFCIGAADVLFHYEMWEFGRPKLALSLALAFVLLLMMIIAGRMVSALASDPLKAPGDALQAPLGRYNAATLAVSGAALISWAVTPMLEEVAFGKAWVGALLLLAAVMNLVGQARWAKPRLAGFQIAYGFIALGFVLTALGMLWDDYDFATGGLYAWTMGSIGTLTLAMMTWTLRARRSLAAAGAIVLYGLGLIAGLAWTVAGVYPEWTLVLLPVSGFAWIAAFVGFAILYGRALFSPRLHERNC